MHHIIPFLLLLLLPPRYTAAQSQLDQFKGNSGEFTPSMVIVLLIGIIFLMTGFLAVFLRQFSDGCFGLSVRPPNAEVDAEGRLVARGLDAEKIKALPTYYYSDVRQHRRGKVELECPVCLCEFQDTDVLRLLPGCSHVFHPRCIDPWLVAHVTCPICRQSLEPGSDAVKPHGGDAIINIPQVGCLDQSDGPDDATRQHRDQDAEEDDHDGDESNTYDDDRHDHHDDGVGKKQIVGKFPRSHSTGHSMADSERFTLILPEEVQKHRFSYAVEPGLSSMLSPRCGYHNCGPGLVRSALAPGSVGRASKNMRLQRPMTSDRLWPI